MQTRIKTIRKELGLTQTEFGESIGLKQTSVAGYETGARTPSEAIVLAICKEYNVNEEWLRTGKGEMYRQKTRHDEIAEYAAKLVGGLSGRVPDKPCCRAGKAGHEILGHPGGHLHKDGGRIPKRKSRPVISH